MLAAGLAAFERARADGQLQAAYAGQASIEVPADLAAALDAEPAARALPAAAPSAASQLSPGNSAIR